MSQADYILAVGDTMYKPLGGDLTPAQIAKRALQVAKLQAYDVLILDTAGRLSIDEALMAELRDIKKITNDTL